MTSGLTRILLRILTVCTFIWTVTSNVSAFSTATTATSNNDLSFSSPSSSSLSSTSTKLFISNNNNHNQKYSPGRRSAASAAKTLLLRSPSTLTNSIMSTSEEGLRQRGGGSKSSSTALKQADSVSPAAPKKRIRIAAFDSMRFFLIASIVLGHFIRFANPNDFIFKLCSQHNVIVGAFFALSGYVTAYTSTEVGQRQASAKLVSTPSQTWTLSRVFGWYPLHFLTLVLFSPLFIYADHHYNGWLVTAWHGILSVTLTQAWFPMHAEVWNAPTWYLSGLAFATALMPFALPKIATLNKKSLRKTAVWLTLINILPKLGYIYDFVGTTSMPEGWTSPKLHPNLPIFNMLRFNPAMISAEVLLGAVACRLVMLDDDSSDETEPQIRTNAFSTMGPLVAIIASIIFRATDVFPVTDLLVRSVFFLPLFLKLLMACHRNTIQQEKSSDGNDKSVVVDPLVSFLSHPFLVWLGNLSFPIYIVHGPLGQVFYKKLIAQKLFGQVLSGPGFFGLYLLSVFSLAWFLQQTFLQSKKVAEWSKSTVQELSSWM